MEDEIYETLREKVNIQDFLQIFQGSRIGKMEDNLPSADPEGKRVIIT